MSDLPQAEPGQGNTSPSHRVYVQANQQFNRVSYTGRVADSSNGTSAVTVVVGSVLREVYTECWHRARQIGLPLLQYHLHLTDLDRSVYASRSITELNVLIEEMTRRHSAAGSSGEVRNNPVAVSTSTRIFEMQVDQFREPGDPVYNGGQLIGHVSHMIQPPGRQGGPGEFRASVVLCDDPPTAEEIRVRRNNDMTSAMRVIPLYTESPLTLDVNSLSEYRATRFIAGADPEQVLGHLTVQMKFRHWEASIENDDLIRVRGTGSTPVEALHRLLRELIDYKGRREAYRTRTAISEESDYVHRRILLFMEIVDSDLHAREAEAQELMQRFRNRREEGTSADAGIELMRSDINQRVENVPVVSSMNQMPAWAGHLIKMEMIHDHQDDGSIIYRFKLSSIGTTFQFTADTPEQAKIGLRNLVQSSRRTFELSDQVCAGILTMIDLFPMGQALEQIRLMEARGGIGSFTDLDGALRIATQTPEQPVATCVLNEENDEWTMFVTQSNLTTRALSAEAAKTNMIRMIDDMLAVESDVVIRQRLRDSRRVVNEYVVARESPRGIFGGQSYHPNELQGVVDPSFGGFMSGMFSGTIRDPRVIQEQPAPPLPQAPASTVFDEPARPVRAKRNVRT